jgi:hypothetical protein
MSTFADKIIRAHIRFVACLAGVMFALLAIATMAIQMALPHGASIGVVVGTMMLGGISAGCFYVARRLKARASTSS